MCFRMRMVMGLVFGQLVFGIGFSASAPVGPGLAREAAARHLSHLPGEPRSLGDAEFLHDDHNQVVVYLFHLEPTGYLAVSADDRLPPVLAYSRRNDAPEGNGDDPLRFLLRSDTAGRLQISFNLERDSRWDTSSDKFRFEQWPAEGSTSTGGWVESRWSQGPPYNQFCPLDVAGGGSRSVAGCPAVAMGQILQYLHQGASVVFTDDDDYIHNYGGNYFRFDDGALSYGFPTWPQLNGHLENLQDLWDQGLETDDTGAAALVFACGVAAHQVYNSGGSGTFGVDQALMAYRRFGFSDCKLFEAEDPELLDRMIENMQAAYPAHLAVVNPDWTSGHNVVVDGYNSDGFFHVNFGWGGPYDGWYLLPSGLPYNLTVYEGVILDITAPISAAPLPTRRLMARAWPNPFNPRVEISFTLPQSGRVNVTVHDTRGRRIRTLLQAEVAAGLTSVAWDGCDQSHRPLASGNYVYCVKAGTESVTGKLVLVR